MSTQALKDTLAGTLPTQEADKGSPVVKFERVLQNFIPQLQRALPAHLKGERMARLALSAFQTTKHLDKCTGISVLSSLMTAGVLGLEPGVNGQGYLIPYFDNKKNQYVCTFVPGWKGLMDLVSRSGRAGAWTGAVFKGDQFDWALGDRPFVLHKPGDGASGELQDLTHVYSVGRVNGAEWPIVEVWPIPKVWKHRDKYNRQGQQHYSFREPEMYARKVPLLQVLKYLPSSIEIAAAMALSDRLEQGRGAHLDASMMVDLTEAGGPDEDGVVPPPPPPPADTAPSKAKGRGKSMTAAEADAAVDAVERKVEETRPAAATPAPKPSTQAPSFSVEQYTNQVMAASSEDEAATLVDIARSEHGAEAYAPVLAAYKAKFPAK